MGDPRAPAPRPRRRRARRRPTGAAPTRPRRPRASPRGARRAPPSVRPPPRRAPRWPARAPSCTLPWRPRLRRTPPVRGEPSDSCEGGAGAAAGPPRRGMDTHGRSGDPLRVLNGEIVGCTRCPRLVAHREAVALAPPRRFRGERYAARPLSGFGDRRARLLLIGLAPVFAHGAVVRFADGVTLIGSYHPSQQNTFTGKLTRPMFRRVFTTARRALAGRARRPGADRSDRDRRPAARIGRGAPLRASRPAHPDGLGHAPRHHS